MAHQKLEPNYTLTEDKIQALRQIVPEAFEDGKINFDTLREVLGDWVEEGEDERFGLTWPGKRDARRLAAIPSKGTLVPVYGDGLKADGTPDEDGHNDSRNVFIEGENLEVLKILHKSYAGRIKMIYIDPPYNTGNDFVYDDDFTEPLQHYLRRTGQIDDEGRALTTNKRADGRFHSKWLSMMYPRLKIARELLREDGVIFVSIDDNEVHNLRELMNEVFGEENFVASVIWQKKFSRANDAKYFSTMHDYILCFSKNQITTDRSYGWELNLLPRGNEIPKGYSNPDDDPRGVWTSVVLSAKSGNEKLLYEITSPSGRKSVPPSGRYWSVNKDKFQELVEDNRIWFGKDGNGTPRLKTFFSEVQQGLRPNTIWFHEEVGHNQEGKQEMKKLFQGKGVFDGPKPVRLLRQIITITSDEKDFIALDFFSGSGTLGQAIIEANSEDSGKRKFICVQLPEATDGNSEARREGYKMISEITRDRLLKVCAKAKEYNNNTYSGFKSFRLQLGQLHQEWNGNVQELFQEKRDWKKDELLYELILTEGFPLDSEVRQDEAYQVNTVRRVQSAFHEHQLLVCLDEQIAEATIQQLDLSGDAVFVCFDHAITDQEKLRLSDKGLIKTIG